MSTAMTLRGLSRNTRWALIGGAVLLLSGLGNGSWFAGLLGAALLIGAGWTLYTAAQDKRDLERPWPWPPDFRALAEGMARPIDPTPKRVLPPDEKTAMIAAVATTDDALARLIADKPPAWPWAVFASVLLQRRNAAQNRLRRCVSGYQPRAGSAALSGQAYSQLAYRTMNQIADLVAQLEQFMLSPAFTGALNVPGDESAADPGAIVGVANRLMDYHDEFLTQAETCLQSPVEPDVRTFVQDMGAFTLCPLVGYQQFITTMCARVGEAQDLLPYTRGGQVVALDDATLTISLPDGLTERIVAHTKSFNGS
jgi:hypothetical protein